MLAWVREADIVIADSLTLASVDLTAQQKVYRNVVLKDMIDSERAHVTELQGLVNNFLRPLEASDMWVNIISALILSNYIKKANNEAVAT